MLCRRFLPPSASRHIAALVCGAGVSWPDVRLAPRRVLVGSSISIALVPHLGEGDQAVLFATRFGEEPEVVNWLETAAPHHYDIVLEIGANNGFFSVFLDALIRSMPSAKLRSVVSFEPSLEAFQRLLANLAANDAVHVSPFRAAVGTAAGFQAFFMPRGHLANGSLLRSFAAQCADEIDEQTVAVIDAASLEYFFTGIDRALLKIDAEGYEPQILQSLDPLIERHRPDIVIEVLAATAQAIEDFAARAGYRRFLLTPAGPQTRERVSADRDFRDWLLCAARTGEV